MSTAGAWTAELETSGQVVFPQRRSRLLIRLAVGLLLMGTSIWTIVEHIRVGDMSGVMGVLRLTALAAFVYIVGWTGWQLITRRPVVTIDRHGISAGRNRQKGLLGWDEISRIDDPSGIPGLRTVQVQPLHGHGSTALGIPQDNVLELGQLSRWLRTLHEQQRDGRTSS